MKHIISLTEFIRNYGKYSRLIEEIGYIILLKNNKPDKVILDYTFIEKNNIDLLEIRGVDNGKTNKVTK
ncbi:MAG: hypothetical protein JXB50_08010 [Spirochaetes bacterium]|nr:hypothetical protein [Spirochaetota bacterium]